MIMETFWSYYPKELHDHDEWRPGPECRREVARFWPAEGHFFTSIAKGGTGRQRRSGRATLRWEKWEATFAGGKVGQERQPRRPVNRPAQAGQAGQASPVKPAGTAG